MQCLAHADINFLNNATVSLLIHCLNCLFIGDGALFSALRLQICQFLWYSFSGLVAAVFDRFPGPALHQQTVAPVQAQL